METVVYREALSPILFDQVKAVAHDLSNSPNYWVSRDVIESNTGCTPAEHAVSALFDSVVTRHLPQDWAGAEYWVQVYEHGRGLAFHFDKDEHIMKESGRMVNPILSSVLYLTGAKDKGKDTAPQAPTVINDQRYNHEENCIVEIEPSCTTLIFPVSNSYCIFNGCAGHGVLECADREERKKERATLLINWWKSQPQNIYRDPNAERLPQHPSALNISGGDGKEAARPAEAVVIPTIHVDLKTQKQEYENGEEDYMTDVLLLDHVVERMGGRKVGEMHAVTFVHPGRALYPLEDDDFDAKGDGKLLIAAALVPEPEEEDNVQ